jgi:predicted transcriptional regulator
MNVKVRKIEVDERTADLLEARAASRGISVADLLADLACADDALPADLAAMRARAEGPWSPEALAEDARRLAEFERTREGVPWDEVKAWMQSWGTPNELPPPRPRKL